MNWKMVVLKTKLRNFIEGWKTLCEIEYIHHYAPECNAHVHDFFNYQCKTLKTEIEKLKKS